MEGFFNYLMEAELEVLFAVIQQHFSVSSRLIMTCLTGRAKQVTSMHRFNPMHPIDFFCRFGWDGNERDVSQLAAELGRPQVSEASQAEEDNEDSLGTWLSGYVICKLTKSS